jgi:hypothetical protein
VLPKPHAAHTAVYLRIHITMLSAGPQRVRAISVQDVTQWQHSLAAKVANDTVLACRSLLYRILQAAEDNGIIPDNPVRKVPTPKPPVNPRRG